MKLKKLSRFIIILLFCSFLPIQLIAQDTTKSLAFKKNRPYRNNPYFYQPDLSYQLLQQFKLVQIANSGDPLAEHELGLRLLTGEGIAPDTIKAVYWIKKAASQKLTSALYNFGIMLINGWGTEWDPFAAYDNFRLAAESGMTQAQYTLGILYTDNLIVPRNWNESYYWIKKSADGGFEPAKDVLPELGSKVSKAFKDSVEENKFILTKIKNANDQRDKSNIQPSLGLVFIDFDMQADTGREITDEMLISDLKRLELKIIYDSLIIKNDSSLISFFDQKNIKILQKIADAGSPEALTILGKLYEDGSFLGKNYLLAAEYYIRATILDSPRAAYLLWNLIRKKDFYNKLNDAVQFDDPTSQFVWYGLQKLGYNNRLTNKDAILLLEKAVAQKHIPSIIELGFDYYSGKNLVIDKQKSLYYWRLAQSFNSIEAEVRIITSQIFDGTNQQNLKNDILVLQTAESKGSLLAQFTLGYCFENGIGIKKSIPNAVKYYRAASQRGNQFAYQQLTRLYNDIRPTKEIFKVN